MLELAIGYLGLSMAKYFGAPLGVADFVRLTQPGGKQTSFT
jgi:hypothetical protein